MRPISKSQIRHHLIVIFRAAMIFCLVAGLNGLPAARVDAAGGPPLPPIRKSVPISEEFMSGWFTIIWGDGRLGADQTRYALTDPNGKTTWLQIDETLARSLGGTLALNHTFVSVQGTQVTRRSGAVTQTLLQVNSILPAQAPGQPEMHASADVLGSKPWVSIMCKFSDQAVEPRNLAFFQGMYAATRPGLDHFWQELSYNLINVTGSNAYGWFTLPHPESYYNPTDTGQGTDLDSLATDCIAAADSSVNYAPFTGINMMFNTDFDNGWAWGGGRYMNLDGQNRLWSTTWEPPWGYANISVIAHEMGHGFGLPHSSGNYGYTYDNAWDVMSQDRYNCAAATDPTYGCIAQHTIAYYKDMLGWIPAGQIFTAGLGTNTTITLEQVAQPQTTNYKLAIVPIGESTSHFYTVEARRQVGYDSKLAGNAVIIHEVILGRSSPARVLDLDYNGITSDAGAMWVVGETFSDTDNGISVYVSAATTTGFQVNITTPSAYYEVSGHVYSPFGTGLGGVLMSGLPNDPLTDADGFYSDAVVAGWSGTVTPTKGVLTFDPPSRSYTNVSADQADQDYQDTYLKILYAKPSAAGVNDCSSWANACILRDAIAAASGGEEVWAAAGTYFPTSGTDNSISFQLKSGVALFGGFDGSETLRSQRGPAAHVTILSGDIGIAGNTSDNSRHVVRGATGAILDGFTITGGNAGTNYGGGVYNYASSPLISNSIISGNSANYGGGMINWVDSRPTLTNVTFENNSATYGGGIYNSNSSPILTDVTFQGNTASGDGGGMENYGSSPKLTNVTFVGNTASTYGGGISNWSSSSPELKNCTFYDNQATEYSGAVFNYSSSPTLINVTINNNVGAVVGGAISNWGGSAPQLHNVIIWGNSPASDQIFDYESTTPVSDSVIQGGFPGGSNILTTDPMLGSLGDYGGYTQVVPLQGGSSAIDTGNVTYCPATDQRGIARPQGSQCDIGAFEFTDVNPPTVTAFTVTTPINSLNIPITTFTATDDASVTGYLVTESSAPPASGAAGWTALKPSTYTVAAAGSYTLYPWAKDAVGHVSAVFASPRTVLVDLTPPETSLGSHPLDPTNQTSAGFTFSSPDGSATFQCSLDGGGYAACTSPKNYTGLSAGAHTFSVRAKDPAGNVDPSPASFPWLIDLTPPDTQIVSGPANPANLTSAAFTFSSPDATAVFECFLDTGGFSACTSPKNYTGLSAGAHTFQVRAKDLAGNVDGSPASHNWQIDLTAPAVASSNRAGPNPVHAATVSFTVTFSEAVTGVGVSDFSLTVSGVTGAFVSGVSGSGSVYTVTVNTGSGEGTLRLDLPNTASITDLAGNALAGLPYTSGQAYTIVRLREIFLPLIVR